MDLIALYARSQSRRGLSPATVGKRTRYLRIFESEAGLGASREQVEDWLDRFTSAKSRATVLSHLSCFYEWACENHADIIRANPTAKIRAPKLPKRLPRPLADDELGKLLANSTPKVRLMLLLGCLGGLRRAEIAGLDREDVLLAEGLLRVLGKGNKERLVPLHQDVRDALELLPMAKSGPLFRQRGGARMTPDDIGHAVGDFIHSLEVSGGAHRLRHTFATKLLAITHDPRVVGETLGHADLRSVMVYADWDRELAKVGVNAMKAG